MEPVRVPVRIDNTDNANYNQVMQIMKMFFGMTEEEGYEAANTINDEGYVIAGHYIREIAETKIDEVIRTCELNEFELPIYIDGEEEVISEFVIDLDDNPEASIQALLAATGADVDQEELAAMLKTIADGLHDMGESANGVKVVMVEDEEDVETFIKAMEEEGYSVSAKIDDEDRLNPMRPDDEDDK